MSSTKYNIDKIREFTLRHNKDVGNTFMIEVVNHLLKKKSPPDFFEWMLPKYRNGMQLYLFIAAEYNMLIPEYKDFIEKTN